MTTVYLLSPTISFKTFKLLQKKLVKESGPVPVEGDRMLWELLRDKKLYCYFTNKLPEDMAISLKLPKSKIIIIQTD